MLNYAASARPHPDPEEVGAAIRRPSPPAAARKILRQCKTLGTRRALTCARFRAPQFPLWGERRPVVPRGEAWPSPRPSHKQARGKARRKACLQRRNTPAVAEFSKEQELSAYREMLLIRRFEEKAGQMYGMGLIGGFCHLYIGQEAVVVGMQMTLKPGDEVITGYRDHGHMLACNMDPKGVMAELTGRARRLFARQGRLDAHVLRREGLLRRPRHRRRAGLARHRARLRQPLSQERQCEPHLFRRRRRQSGPGLRELQHGGAVEAARGLHHREQPLRHGHRDHALVGDHGPVASAASRSTSRASRSTAWMCAP